MNTLYGIKSCDTCRKARKALDARGIAYRYHDLREDGLDAGTLARFIDLTGLETLLNTRSTTWRGLDETERQAARDDAERARALILAHPTLLKRPLLDTGETLIVGRARDDYASLA
ncbi:MULTISPECIES: ArsC family reductase [unclassified Modicisalibacter]|uniref:ArsC family reductase n=1 Tax=unclassified Modicisalibacter TaxID=2679913 RepID=UPI001CCBC272|nr:MULTISPECIES: ArsC family reductase [unclassified Modicisalibacter]MBZ9558138.1 ArsC family reductase [Modicisalibacter sp. R2A 31.J]MBZ9573193.1 ArsC family reductase [Modicisalibacter sp. MOD 31.J]